MTGILFETQSVVASAPNRADIACFAGFVGRRNTPLPPGLHRWLTEQGWASPPDLRLGAVGTEDEVASLLDVPVPIESWDTFHHLFAWEQRPLGSSNAVGVTYLGAAVRSFFAQGGQRCYVVRVGDPWAFAAERTERLDRLSQLIPGYRRALASQFEGTPGDRASWRGVGHVFGLPELSFLCLPDLPDAVRVDLVPPKLSIERPETPEVFVECSAPEPPLPTDRGVRSLLAPRCDREGYQEWAKALNLVANVVARHQREVQLVAAIPLPAAGTAAAADLFRVLTLETELGALAKALEQPGGLASAFVQLVYPWVRSPGSVNLPEQLESPDAVLTGILARNAITQGTFRSAATLHLADVYEVFPILSSQQMARLYPDTNSAQAAQHQFGQRISLLGRTPDGLRLLSDVTTSLKESYRPASVNRLVAAIVKAARRLGEALGFEASGELLWGRLRQSLNSLLLGLLQAGALQGTTPESAFVVRCDRSTMTQNDIDHGRVIVEITFQATLPIEQITVVLVLNDAGQLALLAA